VTEGKGDMKTDDCGEVQELEGYSPKIAFPQAQFSFFSVH
jgi:hypothetical protein